MVSGIVKFLLDRKQNPHFLRSSASSLPDFPEFIIDGRRCRGTANMDANSEPVASSKASSWAEQVRAAVGVTIELPASGPKGDREYRTPLQYNGKRRLKPGRRNPEPHCGEIESEQ
jgi:hypothetical protein